MQADNRKKNTGRAPIPWWRNHRVNAVVAAACVALSFVWYYHHKLTSEVSPRVQRIGDWQYAIPTFANDTKKSKLALNRHISAGESRSNNRDSVDLPIKKQSGYVGSESCKACHPENYHNFGQTAHANSFGPTDPEGEPSGVRFSDASTGKHYEVKRENGRLIHREETLASNNEVLAVSEAAIAYTFGSGTHAKTYAFETDGFLVESPITWYHDTKSWGLSPGFDSPQHGSFERTIVSRCMYCHSGRIRSINENPKRFEIVEHAISCERCHGPGDAHVRFHENKASKIKKTDPIIHPGKLSRDAKEAICQQCHLQGEIYAVTKDHDLWDFRPGENLRDIRTDFQRIDNDEGFKIVGHVEQLQQSKCYQMSNDLTCTTCHDIHSPPAAEDLATFQRQNCLKCHESSHCTKPLAQRGNDLCASCHMPRSETDVTHASLHHHQIGIFRDTGGRLAHVVESTKPKSHIDAPVASYLAPILDDSKVPLDERNRRELLAVYRLAMKNGSVDLEYLASEDTRQRVSPFLMRSSFDAGIADGVAWHAQQLGEMEIAAKLAEKILKVEEGDTECRTYALSILAEYRFSQQKNREAENLFEELTRVRFTMDDHYLLGLARFNRGDTDGAIEALERALQINPTSLAAHQLIRAVLSQSGDQERASQHLRVLNELRRLERR